ncbi:MAG: hypothetical protein ACE5IJ_06300 [Thermoplasmata archaeon]
MSFFAVLDFLGFATFLLSAVIAYRNYAETRDISKAWLTFAVALTVGSLWALFMSLEWMGIVPVVTDVMEDALFPLVAVALAVYSIQAHRSALKPVR